MSANDQLSAIAELHRLLGGRGIDYWLFGGWAVDFHAGAVTRQHDDIDVVVRQRDMADVADLVSASGWRHAPEPGEDGYTGYERGPLRIELAFAEHGAWAPGALDDDVEQLNGVTARVVSLASLVADKSEDHDDPAVTAKDRADLATLTARGAKIPSKEERTR